MHRLADRLALLVSEGGEAENAGRAASSLARRMGLSGGDLKEIFLTGAAGGVKARRDTHRSTDEDTAKLEREISRLRHSLTLAEVANQNAELQRAVYETEIDRLNGLLAGRIAKRRHTFIWAALAFVVLATSGIVALELRSREALDRPGKLEADAASSLSVPRPARVRNSGAAMFPAPERSGAVIAMQPAGAKLVVDRLFWRSLMQWAEVVDGAGRHGYVVTTDIDIP